MKKLFTLLTLLLCIVTGTRAQGDVFTFTFTGGKAISDPAGFFTHDAEGKWSFNAKFTGAEYDGVSYSNGLKMEGSTKIIFNTTAKSDIIIVQSDWSDKTIKLDGNELDVTAAETGTGCRVYTISDVAAGMHDVTRGNGESGLFLIKVTYTEAGTLPTEPLSTTVLPQSAIITIGGTATFVGEFAGGSFDGQWVSDNESVATVDQEGVVTGVGAGVATITYQWADDQSQDAYKASAEITVLDVQFDPSLPIVASYDFTTFGETELTIDDSGAIGSIWNQGNSKNNNVFVCTNPGLENIAVQAVYASDKKGWKISEDGLLEGSGAGRCAAILGIEEGQFVEFIHNSANFYTKSDNSDSGIQKVVCLEEVVDEETGLRRIIFYALESGMIGFEMDKGKYISQINIYQEGAQSLTPTSISFDQETVNCSIYDSYVSTPSITTDPAGLAVTYSSTNEEVATVDPSTGEVTITGIVGTTTIKASFAGDESFLASNASYTLNVTLPVVSEKVWNFAEWEEADFEETTIIDDLQLNAKSGANLAINSSVLKFGGTGKADQRSIRFRLAAGQHIIALLAKSASKTTTTDKETGEIKYVEARPLRISFGQFGGNDIQEFSMVAGAGLTENYIYCNTTEDTDVYVYSGQSGINLSSLIVTQGSVPITIGKSGLNTLVAPIDIDFTLDPSLEAYVAVAAENGYVTLEQVQQAPAGTPLVLKAEPGVYYEALAYGAAEPAVNLLKAGDSQTTIGGDNVYDYVLKGGEFHRASEGENPTFEGIVPTGKAYLSLDAPAARTLKLVFGEATGISTVNTAVAEGSIYTLSGARVAQPQKGLYIQNGKKLIVK